MALPWCYNAVPMVTAVQEDAGWMSELFHYGIRATSTLICYQNFYVIYISETILKWIHVQIVYIIMWDFLLLYDNMNTNLYETLIVRECFDDDDDYDRSEFFHMLNKAN